MEWRLFARYIDLCTMNDIELLSERRKNDKMLSLARKLLVSPFIQPPSWKKKNSQNDVTFSETFWLLEMENEEKMLEHKWWDEKFEWIKIKRNFMSYNSNKNVHAWIAGEDGKYIASYIYINISVPMNSSNNLEILLCNHNDSIECASFSVSLLSFSHSYFAYIFRRLIIFLQKSLSKS